MTIENPRVCTAIVELASVPSEIRADTVISATAIAKLTRTSEAYWDDLRTDGIGPRCTGAFDKNWYVVEDVLDWLVDAFNREVGARDD